MKFPLVYQWWDDGGIDTYHIDETASTEAIAWSDSMTNLDHMEWFKLELTEQILKEIKEEEAD